MCLSFLPPQPCMCPSWWGSTLQLHNCICPSLGSTLQIKSGWQELIYGVGLSVKVTTRLVGYILVYDYILILYCKATKAPDEQWCEQVKWIVISFHFISCWQWRLRLGERPCKPQIDILFSLGQTDIYIAN